MTTRQQKNRLRLTTWGLALPTVVATTWALLWPIDSEYGAPTESLRPKLGSSNLAAADTDSRDRVVIDTNWNRKLRSWDLETSDNVASTSAELRVESAAGLRLVGTVLEPGATFAMIADQSGTIDLQPEGGILAIEPNGVRVESISAHSVVINYRGVAETLALVSLQDTPAQGTASESGSAPPTGDENGESIAPENLDDELDWLNGEPPMPAVSSQGKEK